MTIHNTISWYKYKVFQYFLRSLFIFYIETGITTLLTRKEENKESCLIIVLKIISKTNI